jgi:hypothetical protein
MKSRGSEHERSAPRDQRESAFAGILADLVARVPGALAAAMVDMQGETVDYAGRAAPFALRVTAAHLQIVLFEAHKQRSLSALRWCSVRTARRGYLIWALPEAYALVVVFARAAGFAGWHRAVAACARALAREASWGPMDAWCEPWFSVEVIADGRQRPQLVRVGGRTRPLEIVGAVVPAGPGEAAGAGARGWRVRLDTGAETTLVRERGGAWYAADALEGVLADPPGPFEKKTR